MGKIQIMMKMEEVTTSNKESLLHLRERLENWHAMIYRNSLILPAVVGILAVFLCTFTDSIDAQNVDNPPESIESIDSIDSLEQTASQDDSNVTTTEQNGKDDDKLSIIITFPVYMYSFQHSLNNYPSQVSDSNDYYGGGVDLEIGHFSGLMAHIGFRYFHEVAHNTRHQDDEYPQLSGHTDRGDSFSGSGGKRQTVGTAMIGFGKYFRFGKEAYKKHAFMLGVGWAVRSYTLSEHVNRVANNGRQYRSILIKEQFYNPYGLYFRAGYYFFSKRHFALSLLFKGYHAISGYNPHHHARRKDSLLDSSSLNLAIGAHF